MNLKFKLILLLCFLSAVNVHAQLNFAMKSGKLLQMDFYNDFGMGYGMNSAILTEQLNISLNDCLIGFLGQFGARNYAGKRTPDPNTTIHQYRFVNEYAVLIGKEFHSTDRNMFVISVGPTYRWSKFREWPDKGAGAAPLLGVLMWRNPAFDTKSYGFRITAIASHSNLANSAAIGLGAFFSYANREPAGGATLNFLFGRVR